MAAELRWILAGLGVLLLAGIWWWGARRSRQAPGNAALREAMGTAPAQSRAPDDAGTAAASNFDHDPAARDWGVPPFEPLSIRTAEFDEVPAVEPPLSSRAQPFQAGPLDAAPLQAGPLDAGPVYAEAFATSPGASGAEAQALPSEPWPATPEAGTPALETPDESQPSGAPPAPKASPTPNRQPAATAEPAAVAEPQHIVSIRVCAAADTPWPGIELLAALESHGLAHGRYSVFHRKHSDGRTQFCAASLVEPGTFSLASMPHEEYRGLTLFAVLPGPVEPLRTFEALIETAAALAQTLDGTLQDADGLPLTMQRAATLRAEVARLQSLLTLN